MEKKDNLLFLNTLFLKLMDGFATPLYRIFDTNCIRTR